MSAGLLLSITTISACAEAAPPNPDASSHSSTDVTEQIATVTPDAAWDDGLAEIAVYDAQWTIYGKDRAFEARLITAKEPFDMTRHVKADSPYAGRAIRDVLKENLIMEIPTENYPYRFLRTVFVLRDEPAELVKATVGSQEWCGNTFHDYRSWTTPPSYEFHSYFDGEGDGTKPIDLRPGDLFRDQLFSSLRFLADEPVERHVRLWPSWLSNHVKPMAPVDGVIRRAPDESVRAAGREWKSRRLDVEAGSLKESYWFSDDAVRVLVRYESSDGRALLLKDVGRRDYWTRR